MIYHLALPADWEQARAAGEYALSTRGLSIAQQGFLHASRDLGQARRVAAAFYADVPQLVCLAMDEAALAEAGLVVDLEPGDPSDPASELFPHVYGGPIPAGLMRPVSWR